MRNDTITLPRAVVQAALDVCGPHGHALHNVAGLAEVLRKALESQPTAPAGEPVAWLVCSVNADGSLSLEHAAPFEEAAHEHINDAITKHGIEGASSWVVRPANIPPQPREPLSKKDQAAVSQVLRFASADADAMMDDQKKDAAELRHGIALIRKLVGGQA